MRWYYGQIIKGFESQRKKGETANNGGSNPKQCSTRDGWKWRNYLPAQWPRGNKNQILPVVWWFLKPPVAPVGFSQALQVHRIALVRPFLQPARCFRVWFAFRASGWSVAHGATFDKPKRSGNVGLRYLQKWPTRMGFEPTRAEHIGLAVQRLNHSATSSIWTTNPLSRL